MEAPLLNKGPTHFPLAVLRSDSDPDIGKLERMGGTLSHLLGEYGPEVESKSDSIALSYIVLFNKAVVLWNYAVSSEVALAYKGFDKFVGLFRLIRLDTADARS